MDLFVNVEDRYLIWRYLLLFNRYSYSYLLLLHSFMLSCWIMKLCSYARSNHLSSFCLCSYLSFSLGIHSPISYLFSCSFLSNSQKGKLNYEVSQQDIWKQHFLDMFIVEGEEGILTTTFGTDAIPHARIHPINIFVGILESSMINKRISSSREVK